MSLSATVAILCFNEHRGLKNTYTTYKKILTSLSADHEFLIINDGSSSQTAVIAEEIKNNDSTVTVLTNPKPRGMGYGFKMGLEKASKELYIGIGGYNALSEENVIRLIDKANEYDITLAYITNPQIRIKCRRILSCTFTLIMNKITGFNLFYYNAMHIVRTSCLRKINIRSNQQTYNAECVYKLLKFHNCSFREIPVAVNFSQKTNKNAVSKFKKWVINIFDGFKFFYFLFYDMTLNSKNNLPKDL